MEVILMSAHLTRPSTKRAWYAAPIIAAFLLTGCAAQADHAPVTAKPHATRTHQSSCPPGTHQRSDACLNNGTAVTADASPNASPTCPPGTHRRAGECLTNVHVIRPHHD
jgi:hypothetical protein